MVNSTVDAVQFDLGVSTDGTTLVMDAAGDFVGLLPDNIGTYPVVYSATATVGEEMESDEASFTIRLADTPEAVTELDVATAGPSSLKVTWEAGSVSLPIHNNSPIILYELHYRAAGATAWLPALLPESIAQSKARIKSYTIQGLAPGDYVVRVRASNILGPGPWVDASGSTGAGPGKVTLTLTVDETIPEGRVEIPVKVTATVPPSTMQQRNLVVTLTLGGVGPAEDRAELPNVAGIPSDLAWDLPVATVPTRRTHTFVFNSNLSSETTVFLNTAADDDAEDETFRIIASAPEHPGVFAATKPPHTRATVMIDDAEVQEYKLELPVALESSGQIKEGHGDETVDMWLGVSPPRTLPKSFFVNLESVQDASDYSLTSGGTSSGGPTAVSLRIDMPVGVAGATESRAPVTLTAASNDGDRVDDTITLQLFETAAASPTTAGDMVGDAVMLKVLDQHRLPTVTMGTITVDGAAVNSLMEGQTGTVTLMADRGTATDATPDVETIMVALTHGAASSASAATTVSRPRR